MWIICRQKKSVLCAMVSTLTSQTTWHHSWIFVPWYHKTSSSQFCIWIGTECRNFKNYNPLVLPVDDKAYKRGNGTTVWQLIDLLMFHFARKTFWKWILHTQNSTNMIGFVFTPFIMHIILSSLSKFFWSKDQRESNTKWIDHIPIITLLPIYF